MKYRLILLQKRCLPQRNYNIRERNKTIEYYTLLTIGYSFLEHHMEFNIWFASEDECWSILLANGTLYDQINATEGHCDVTDVASKIVKPKLRPW